MPLDAAIQSPFDAVRRAWDRGRLAQAYILSGSVRGAGGELARRILSLLFCQAESGRPCGVCPGCRGALEDRLADVSVLEPLKASQQIDVAQVRNLTRFMGETSYAGGWKAGLLLYADRMTAAAANAFLKALEEPPPRSLFLLLSDQPSGMLPTIVSRCQKLALPTDHEAIRPWMEPIAAMMSDRGIGALAGMAAAAELGAILEKKKEEIEKAENDAAPDSLSDDEEDALKARIVARYKEARALALQALLLWHRDVLAVASGADASVLVFGDSAEEVRRQAARLTVPQALTRVEAVEEMQAQLDQNVNESLVLETVLTRLAGALEPATAGRNK